MVLSRRLNERIHVGEEIIITVVEIERGKVRIGVEAPNVVKVYREELLDQQQIRKHLENTRANGPKAAAPAGPENSGERSGPEQRLTPFVSPSAGGGGDLTASG